jgi:hypothetical protein
VFAGLFGGNSILGGHTPSKAGKTSSSHSSSAGSAHGKDGKSISNSGAARGLVVDADGFVTVTSVLYVQLAQPKGRQGGVACGLLAGCLVCRSASV